MILQNLEISIVFIFARIDLTKSSLKLILGKTFLKINNISFFQLDLPAYTTDEICKKRIVTAITMCGEIDTDNSANYIPDDDDHE